MVNAKAERDKTTVRIGSRATRASRPQEQRASAAQTLVEHAVQVLPPPQVDVTCYSSLPSEPGTGPLIAELLARGYRVWLPRIAGRALEWVQIGPMTDYQPGALGIMEPVGTGQAFPATVGVMLMPAIAVDLDGHRIGQGGGFFDRTLAAIPARSDGGPLRVALVFDDEVHAQIPNEEHDRPVDVIATPTRTIAIATRG